MSKIFNKYYLILLVSLVIALGLACEANNPASIYDPNKKGNPTPKITKMVPEDSTLAGIGEIAIIGENFSPVPDQNLVYFDKTRAAVNSASATELKVQSPNILGDSIKVKIAVQGAYLFSNIMYYKLTPAVWEYGGFDDYDDAYALAMDKDENLYVSLKGKKIVKVTPDGEQQPFSDDTGFDKASGMKVGPGGSLYFVNILGFMFRIPPEGGKYQMFASLPGGAFDLDFDANGNIFCGGSGNAIYRVKADGTNDTVAEYPKVYIRSVRVYNGYVYVAGDYTGTDTTQVQSGVWRNQILDANGTLGESELVLDWGAISDYKLKCINFAEDGDMFVGTDAPEAIIIFHSDGSSEPLYPGVLEPESYAMCWGNSRFLYVTRRNIDASKKRIIKINVQRNGAPYYGRQL